MVRLIKMFYIILNKNISLIRFNKITNNRLSIVGNLQIGVGIQHDPFEICSIPVQPQDILTVIRLSVTLYIRSQLSDFNITSMESATTYNLQRSLSPYLIMRGVDNSKWDLQKFCIQFLGKLKY